MRTAAVFKQKNQVKTVDKPEASGDSTTTCSLNWKERAGVRLLKMAGIYRIHIIECSDSGTMLHYAMLAFGYPKKTSVRFADLVTEPETVEEALGLSLKLERRNRVVSIRHLRMSIERSCAESMPWMGRVLHAKMRHFIVQWGYY